MTQHRHRRLGRNALHLADQVAVQHDVADNENFDLRKAAFKKIQDRVKLSKHRFKIPTNPAAHGTRQPTLIKLDE